MNPLRRGIGAWGWNNRIEEVDADVGRDRLAQTAGRRLARLERRSRWTAAASRVHGGGADDDRSSGQGLRGGSLREKEPYPERREHRLDEKQERDLKCADLTDAGGNKHIRQRYLKDPEIGDDEPVPDVRILCREGERCGK